MEMTRKDEALQDLVKGKPWKQLTKQYSKSTLYDAHVEWESLAIKKYEEFEDEKKFLLKEIEIIYTSVTEKEKQQKTLETRVSELQSSVNSLEDGEIKLGNQVQENEEKLQTLQIALGNLEGRGISIEKLLSILDSDTGSSEDLMERVRTKQQHGTLTKEVKLLEKKQEQILRTQEVESERLTSLRTMCNSEKNRLDELKTRNLHWLDSIELAVQAYDRGFTTEILRGLLNNLFNLSVKGEPILSAKRLLNRLEKIREEIELDASITAKKKELSILKREHTELKATIKTLKNDVIKNVTSTQNEGIRKLKQVTDLATREILGSKDELLNAMKIIEQTSSQTIANLEKSGKASINNLHLAISNSLYNNHLAIKLAVEQYTSEIQKWGDLRQEAGKYSSLINMATILFGVQEDENAILSLSPAIITRLAERIHIYILKKYPGEETLPPKDLAYSEMGLSCFFSVNLSSLTRWLVDDLKRRERGEKQ